MLTTSTTVSGIPSLPPGVFLLVSIIGDSNPTTYQFPVGTEDEQSSLPARTSVIFALGGLFVYSLGIGLRTIAIAGSTGYRALGGMLAYGAEGTTMGSSRNPRALVGFLAMRDLEAAYMRYLRAFAKGQEPHMRLIFNNPLGAGALEITPIELAVTRNKAEPLLYRFTLRATVLQDLYNAEGDDFGPVADIQTASDASARAYAMAAANTVAPPPEVTYMTRAGDTIDAIAQAFQAAPGEYTTTAAILQANQQTLTAAVTGSTPLAGGSTLMIPVLEAPNTTVVPTG
ncbi:MAG TPA: hypothetical protein VIU62_12420 [Chloroflexota bacterium]|jgi:hypothetical protein